MSKWTTLPCYHLKIADVNFFYFLLDEIKTISDTELYSIADQDVIEMIRSDKNIKESLMKVAFTLLKERH
jgi:hypothetical protein